MTQFSASGTQNGSFHLMSSLGGQAMRGFGGLEGLPNPSSSETEHSLLIMALCSAPFLTLTVAKGQLGVWVCERACF